jgi:nucleoside-diphosphate-sugar epimerase
MARIVVIGGSGHVGTYLLPALVERGHKVLNVSRGTASPYREHATWEAIEHVAVDRKTEEAEGRFGARSTEALSESFRASHYNVGYCMPFKSEAQRRYFEEQDQA